MKRPWLSFLFICVWLAFVVSLSVWWLIFSLEKIDQLSGVLGPDVFLRQRQMLMTEGIVLVASLALGGAALIYFAIRERRRLEEVKLFFSNFTHDIKTSMTRLSLKGELLAGTHGEEPLGDFYQTLKDIELQLENSLLLTQDAHSEVRFESISLASVFARIRQIWPELSIHLKGEGEIVADLACVESILRNLVSNSVIHGKASEVTLVVSKEPGVYKIHYTDNGTFEGGPSVVSGLGRKLAESTTSTGVGLFLVRQMCRRLKGQVELSLNSNSLVIDLSLPLRGLK